MTDDPAPGTGANDDGRTDDEPSDNGEDLEAENRELRSRVEELEAMLDTMQDELADVKRAAGTDDSAADQAAGADQAAEQSGGSAVSRRGALAAMAGAGVLGLGATGSASAQTDLYGASDSGSSEQTGFEIDNNNTTDTFTFGIVGRAESERARGVAGFADNTSGLSTALFGRNTSTEGRAIRGFADATSGTTRGIQADCQSPEGLGLLARNQATSGTAKGMRGTTQSTNANTRAIEGEVLGTSGASAAIEGINNSGTNTARGVQGTVGANGGNVWGVNGTTTSSDDFTVGVRGEADATSGITYGVLAENASETDGAAAMNAIKRPSGDKGATYGLKAVNNSTTTDAAAIRAEDNGDNGNATYGVEAITESTSTDAAAVRAEAASGNADAIQGDARGGAGNGIRCFADTFNWYAVYASHEGTGGDGSSAIVAENSVTDEPALEAQGANTTDSSGIGIESNGDVQVNGHVDASQGPRGAIGSRAYLSSAFSVTSTSQTIPFDTLSADQRGEFDTSNNYFECAYDGTYAVEVGIESQDADPTTGNVTVTIGVAQGSAGSNPASGQQLSYDFDANGAVGQTFSTTIYGLVAGNRIDVKISDDSGSLDLTPSEDETFISVRQVGGGGNYTSSPASNSVVVEDPEGE